MTRSTSWLLVCALMVAAALAAAPTMKAELDDAATLQRQHVASVRQLVDGGPRALRERWRAWSSDRERRVDPSPLRIAPVVAGAAWSSVFGATPRSLAWLALSAHLALIALQFAFARRHWGAGAAVSLAALTAFAPLNLGLARLALGDSVSVLCQVASVWLFLEMLREPTRWTWRGWFVVAVVLALLANELSRLLIPSFIAVAWVSDRQLRSTKTCTTVSALLALAALAAASCGLAIAGDWTSFARAVKFSTWAPTRSVYLTQYAAGPWFRCLVDALLISPLPTLLGIAGLAVLAAQARAGRAEPTRARLALLLATQVVALSFFAKSARNTLFLDAFSRVFAVAFLAEWFALGRSLRARVAFVASVASMCALDGLDFRRNFARGDVEDPVTSALAGARRIVPTAPQPDE